MKQNKYKTTEMLPQEVIPQKQFHILCSGYLFKSSVESSASVQFSLNSVDFT